MLATLLVIAAMQQSFDMSPACIAAFEAQGGMLPHSSDEDPATLAPKLDRLEAACAGEPTAAVARTARAGMLLRQGRAREAIVILEEPAVAGGPSSVSAHWLLVAAYDAVGETAKRRKLEAEMLRTHDEAMSGGSAALRMRKVERFETPAATVHAYAGNLEIVVFSHDFVFVAQGKDGGRLASVTVHHIRTPGEAQTYRVNAYNCFRSESIESFQSREPPTYEAMKAKAIAALDTPGLFDPPPKDGKAHVCDHGGQVLPGLH